MPSFTLAIFSVCAGLEHFPFFIYISHGQSKGKDSGPKMRAFAEVISSIKTFTKLFLWTQYPLWCHTIVTFI